MDAESDSGDDSRAGDVPDGDFDDDDASEYTYSDDGEEYGSDADDDAKANSMELENHVDDVPSGSVAGPGTQAGGSKSQGVASKAKVDISALDQILSKCNEIFPEAVHIEDESFLRLITAQDGPSPSSKRQVIPPKKDKPPAEKKSGKRFGVKNKPAEDSKRKQGVKNKPAEDSKRKQSIKTSTGKSGVGYETGTAYSSSSSALKEEMNRANKRQRALDEKCCDLMKKMNSFLADYGGDEGFVLLALKMSPGFNRMLFSLFKNDSLMEWGSRRDVYMTALDLVELLGSSKFLSSFLLHDLLEGDGTQLASGTSNCQTLLNSLHQQADAMKRNQEILLRKKESVNPQEVDPNKVSAMKQGGKLSPEEALARDIIEVCDKINESYQKVIEAIKLGREVGTISEEADTTFLQHGGGKLKTPSEKEDIAAYNREMQEYRLKHVALVEAVHNKKANHKFHSEKEGHGKAKISSVPKPAPQRRMLRITSEIAGLSADLPVHWASGIFVRIDEDRPDIMKACIMAPEDTPYENGVFEFDIMLPLSYPNDPPKVHLMTTGKNTIRFNPNLYQEGKVCLSLLGTWSGPGWIPEKSTLLQVLVSIQSLILVQDPYFNEPGYDASDSGQQARSRQYDKQVRAATLKVAILGQMKKPSPLFEDCINDHFRLKKRRILKQLAEWEELEKAEEKSEGSAINPRTLGNQVVAGGGMRSSPKIVSDLCDEIRTLMETKWPDNAEDD